MVRPYYCHVGGYGVALHESTSIPDTTPPSDVDHDCINFSGRSIEGRTGHDHDSVIDGVP